MKLFVWNDVTKATDNYHDGGGIVVIADSLERARELIEQKSPGCSAATEDPDLVRECEGQEYIAVHRDAGCC
jgi:hypothetical protein